jgi:hypothetical protein
MPSGAKARHILKRYGTTKVVPFLQGRVPRRLFGTAVNLD